MITTHSSYFYTMAAIHLCTSVNKSMCMFPGDMSTGSKVCCGGGSGTFIPSKDHFDIFTSCVCVFFVVSEIPGIKQLNGACDWVDRAFDARSKGQGSDSHRRSCVEAPGKVLIPYWLCPPNSSGYLVEWKMQNYDIGLAAESVRRGDEGVKELCSNIALFMLEWWWWFCWHFHWPNTQWKWLSNSIN